MVLTVGFRVSVPFYFIFYAREFQNELRTVSASSQRLIQPYYFGVRPASTSVDADGGVPYGKAQQSSQC